MVRQLLQRQLHIQLQLRWQLYQLRLRECWVQLQLHSPQLHGGELRELHGVLCE